MGFSILTHGRGRVVPRKAAKTLNLHRACWPVEWRSGNLWGPGGDGVRWAGKMHAARLEWGAHFTATPTARRRLLRWGVDGYERSARHTGGADWAIAGSNRCYARLRET